MDMGKPRWPHKKRNRLYYNGQHKDVTVLNGFSTGSDHRLVRAKVVIDTDKERHRMLKNKANIPGRDQQI